MKELKYIPIGIIHSRFKEPKGTPIQTTAALGVEGSVEVFPEYLEGLKDLEGFSHIVLLYHFHLSKDAQLTVVPYMDDRPHGVFATRAPARPNPIGMSVVRLVAVKDNVLSILDVDIVDGTPLLDIKPYTSDFDDREILRKGWLEDKVKKLPATKDDGRFHK